MSTDTIKESAAAAWAVEEDAFLNTFVGEAKYPRLLKFIGCAGSAAAGDFAFELLIGNFRVGKFYNTTGGAVVPKAADDLLPIGRTLYIPGGANLRAIVKDASGTNPAFITVVTDDAVRSAM